MRRWVSLSLLLALAGCTLIDPAPRNITRWAAYYDTKEAPETFLTLDLVIFDREHHPDLEPLKGKTLLFAYVSMGEVHSHAAEKPELEENEALLMENTRWDSHVVDLRDTRWQEILLEQVADAKAQGFDGVMLDTVDSPLTWAEAQEDEETQASMKAAALAILQQVRTAHPDMKLMLNRGFSILSDAKDHLDFILAESIASNPDDSTGQFILNSVKDYDQAAEQLHRVAALAPQLHLLTLDYWNLDDAEGTGQLYAMQRANGFIPYVTSQDLRQYTPEPSSSH